MTQYMLSFTDSHGKEYVKDVHIDRVTFRAAPDGLTQEAKEAKRFGADAKDQDILRGVIGYLKAFCNVRAQIEPIEV